MTGRGSYVCPYCGSTYVTVDIMCIFCTQCRKRIPTGDDEMSIAEKWTTKERKVVHPKHTAIPETEKAVDDRRETRPDEAPETKR